MKVRVYAFTNKRTHLCLVVYFSKYLFVKYVVAFIVARFLS